MGGIWTLACTGHRDMERCALEILGVRILQRPWKIVCHTWINPFVLSTRGKSPSMTGVLYFQLFPIIKLFPSLRSLVSLYLAAALILNSFDKMSGPFIISLSPTRCICFVWVSILTSSSNFCRSRYSACPFRAQSKFGSFCETSPAIETLSLLFLNF